MFVRSAPETDARGAAQPLPSMARWRLWAQIGDARVMDLMGHRDPRPVVLATDPYGHVILPLGARDANVLAPEGHQGVMDGALPSAVHADALTSVVPMPATATLWSDGDTMLDIRPEHWRPITITLAPPQALMPAPLPPAAAPHPLRVAAGRVGWMLSGVALTFLGGAAVLGGGPLIQAVRSTLAHASARQVAVSPAPAATVVVPAVAPPAPVVASPLPVVAAPQPVAAIPPPVVATSPLTVAAAPAVAASEVSADAPAGPRRVARADRQPPRAVAEPPANRFDTFRRIDVEDPFGAP